MLPNAGGWMDARCQGWQARTGAFNLVIGQEKQQLSTGTKAQKKGRAITKTIRFTRTLPY